MPFFIIPSAPVPQPRQRHRIVAKPAGGQFVANYTPAASPVQASKALARLTWQQWCGDVPPLDGPVYLGVDFVLPKPISKVRKRDSGHRIWCDCKPDVDNLLKALTDALTGLAYHDDRQICSLRATKVYAADCESPKVEVMVMATEPIALCAARAAGGGDE